MKAKTLILIPTLNEVHHISILYKKILALKQNFDFLFIDDASSDGTWEIIKKLKKGKKNKIFAFRRKKRLGLGKAHKDGLLWAYKKKYQYLITMDSDLAHHPKYISKLLKNIKNSDLTLGSRYLEKNSTPNWPLFRIFLSHSAHTVSKILFDHNFDSTNAFRCYNLKKIKKNFIYLCKSDDYDFFFTSLNILNLKRYKISQFPMIIKARVKGNSKMLFKHVCKSIYNMFALFFEIKFKF